MQPGQGLNKAGSFYGHAMVALKTGNYSGARSQNSGARMKREPAKPLNTSEQAFSRLDCLAKGSSIRFIFYSGFWLLTSDACK
jgi:hypothetical protein